MLLVVARQHKDASNASFDHPSIGVFCARRRSVRTTDVHHFGTAINGRLRRTVQPRDILRCCHAAHHPNFARGLPRVNSPISKGVVPIPGTLEFLCMPPLSGRLLLMLRALALRRIRATGCQHRSLSPSRPGASTRIRVGTTLHVPQNRCRSSQANRAIAPGDGRPRSTMNCL